jgi:CHAD domain-containing protein
MIRGGNMASARQRGHPQPAPAFLDCASAFQILARDCLTDIETQRDKAYSGDAEAIRKMRVSITRLRAAVAFFAPMTVDRSWSGLKKDIVWLHAALGAARDSDVIASYARHKKYRAWAKRAGLAASHPPSSRDHRSLARCLRSARFYRLIDGLTSWVGRGRWLSSAPEPESRLRVQSLRTFSRAKLGRWRDRLVHKGRHFAKMRNSRRHRLRIRAKRYRYVLKALMGLDLCNRNQWCREHEAIKRLQRTLGDLRDLESFRRAGAAACRPANDHPGCPRGYRHQRKKLLAAAGAAFRDFKRASGQ